MSPKPRLWWLRQNSWFLAVLSIFMVYSALFLVRHCVFNGPWALEHDSGDIVKTRDFGQFWPFSWSIANFFWSGNDFNGLWPQAHDSGDIVKTRDFVLFWPFFWAITHCFVVWWWFQWPMSPKTRLWWHRQNSWFRAVLSIFMVYSPLFLVRNCVFNGPWALEHDSGDIVKTRDFGHFWPFSWSIANFFWSGNDFNGLW
jgi:hypothetical protein